jgi:hypothetical protein
LTITSGRGAFQLSAARRPESPAKAGEVEEWARRSSAAFGTPSPVHFGTFRGFAVSYSDAGTKWHRYWLNHGRLMVFATYAATTAGVDGLGEVEKMLGTLQAEGGAA